MEFRWNDWNINTVRLHGVTPEEAEHVVESATRPYPLYRQDAKFLVGGPQRPDDLCKWFTSSMSMTACSSFMPGR